MPADSSSSSEAFAFMVDVILTTAALLPSTMVVKSGSVCTAAGLATRGATCACATCAAGAAAAACEEGKFAAPAQYPPAMSAAAPRPAKANFAFMGKLLQLFVRPSTHRQERRRASSSRPRASCRGFVTNHFDSEMKDSVFASCYSGLAQSRGAGGSPGSEPAPDEVVSP